jgi:hypothetical protein
MKNLPLMYFDANPPKLGNQLANVSLEFVSTQPHLLNFIENNAGRLGNSEESNDSGNGGQNSQQRPVRAREIKDIMVLHSLGSVALDFLLRRACLPSAVWSWGA